MLPIERKRERDTGVEIDGKRERETGSECPAVCLWFLFTTETETLGHLPLPNQNPGRRSENNIGKTFVLFIISDQYIIILRALT